MGARGSKHVGPDIPSDDEFDRDGNPRLPPGLEDTADGEGQTSPEGTRSIPIISSLIRSVSKSDVREDVEAGTPEKVGAGLLIVSPLSEENGRQALLLKRSASSGNGNTWGLPGGNRDPGETDLWETALREASEEMGPVEAGQFQNLATVLTKRGKRGEKHYTVYVVEMVGELWGAWRPVLNEEHTEFAWVDAGDLLAAQKKGWGRKAGRELHPVVKIVGDEYGEFLRAILF